MPRPAGLDFIGAQMTIVLAVQIPTDMPTLLAGPALRQHTILEIVLHSAFNLEKQCLRIPARDLEQWVQMLVNSNGLDLIRPRKLSVLAPQ
jgi:hypothetical protein